MISYNIKLKKDLELVWINIDGIIDNTVAQKIVNDARLTANKHNYKFFLYDLRNAILNMPVYQLYQLPRDFEVIPSHRNAAIINKHTPYIEDWRFLENVGVNIGIQIRFFTEEEKALNWLLQ